jgi:hypothetical protein
MAGLSSARTPGVAKRSERKQGPNNRGWVQVSASDTGGGSTFDVVNGAYTPTSTAAKEERGKAGKLLEA